MISVQGQRGILSCFAAHPTMPSLVAAGAFSGDGQFECFFFWSMVQLVFFVVGGVKISPR